MWTMTTVALGGTRANAKKKKQWVCAFCDTWKSWSVSSVKQVDSGLRSLIPVATVIQPATSVQTGRTVKLKGKPPMNMDVRWNWTRNRQSSKKRCVLRHLPKKPLVSDSRSTPFTENIAKRHTVILKLISKLRMRICGLEQSFVFAIVIATSNSWHMHHKLFSQQFRMCGFWVYGAKTLRINVLVCVFFLRVFIVWFLFNACRYTMFCNHHLFLYLHLDQ